MLINATMLTAPVIIVSASLGDIFTPAKAATVIIPLQVLSCVSFCVRCCFIGGVIVRSICSVFLRYA